MSAPRAGDWVCSQCGDNQFARNTECRRCGTVRPVVSNNKQVSKPGDWICPNPQCQDLQFERNNECRRCGTAKPAGAAGREQYSRGGRETKGYDYDYADAGVASYSRGRSQGYDSYGGGGASNTREYSREVPDDRYARQAAPPPPAPSSAYSDKPMKEGDWLCPACGDHQFARNTECRRCGGPKPAEGGCGRGGDRYGGAGRQAERYDDRYAAPERYGRAERDNGGYKAEPYRQPGGGDNGGYKAEPYRQPGGGRYDPYARDAAPRAGGGNADMKEGDWLCASCGDHQFARNTNCRRCGADKPAEGESSYNRGSRAASPYGAGSRAEESYAGHASPYSSYGGGGAAAAQADRGGQSYKAGDWMCASCGDHQFMRNEVCRRCGAAKPETSLTQLKPGDWICPNPDCKDLQFAKNTNCRKCGQEKPEEEEAAEPLETVEDDV